MASSYTMSGDTWSIIGNGLHDKTAIYFLICGTDWIYLAQLPENTCRKSIKANLAPLKNFLL